MSQPPSLHIQPMLRWRGRTASLLALMIVLFAAGALLPLPPIVVDYGAFGLAFLLPLVMVTALVTLYHMFRATAEHGGRRYALEHTGLGVAFLAATFYMPLAFVGILILPLLVRNDITQGVADWRKSDP